MTTYIRGLVVDDKPAKAGLIRASLDEQFEVLDWKVEWTEAHDSITANAAIKNTPFDFAVLDFDLGPDAVTSQTIVETLRDHGGDHPYILVVSGYANQRPRFIDDSREAGANHAIIRRQLGIDPKGDWTFRHLADRIRQHLEARGKGGSIQWDIDLCDLGLLSTLHSLGSPTDGTTTPLAAGTLIVKRLILAALKTPYEKGQTTIAIRHLAPGRSGAYVLRVDRKRGHTVESFVVKLGLMQRALRREREVNPDAYAIMQNALVRIEGGTEPDAIGYAAIYARLAAKAVTLGSWLAPARTEDRPAVAAVRAVADVLFEVQLAPLSDKVRQMPRSVTAWLDLSPVLRQRIERTVTAFRAVWAHPDGAGQADAHVMAESLLRFAELAGTETATVAQRLTVAVSRRLDGDTVFFDAFGDLHSANVLIQPAVQPRPILVDASLFGPAHWASDLARLTVDLVLRVRRADERAMLWTSFDEARAYAAQLCNIAVGGPADDEPVDTFLRHAMGRLPEYAGVERLDLDFGAWHWQWHMALVIEFLRQAGHPDLGPPRVVLALAAAADHLERAGRLVEHRDFTGERGGDAGPCTPVIVPRQSSASRARRPVRHTRSTETP